MSLRIIYSFIAFLLIGTFGCDIDQDIHPDGKVELYLIDSYTTLDHSNQIDENTLITEKSPLIEYSDFIWYDPAEYTFKLSDRATASIQNLERSTNGVPFAIIANDTSLIYAGYFWPSISSGVCDCIVIDPLTTSIGNKIQVRLGYPGLFPEWSIPDKRNDKRLIRIFKQDHKLN